MEGSKNACGAERDKLNIAAGLTSDLTVDEVSDMVSFLPENAQELLFSAMYDIRYGGADAVGFIGKEETLAALIENRLFSPCRSPYASFSTLTMETLRKRLSLAHISIPIKFKNKAGLIKWCVESGVDVSKIAFDVVTLSPSPRTLLYMYKECPEIKRMRRK